MTLEAFISSAGFAALLTAFVTISSCIISYIHGIKKIKTDNFSEVFQCLQTFSQTKTENMKRCNLLIEKLTEQMPAAISASAVNATVCRSLYHDFHAFLEVYSAYLESLMSFYHFLYKDKPNIPATKEECWEILRLYSLFTDTSVSIAQDCKLNYLQIITLIQFIKINSGIAGRLELYRYLKRNRVFQNWWSSAGKAFF